MSEQVIIIILFFICLGQAWAVLKGRKTAVTYYICVAPLSYFSIWQFGTLDPARLCGVIIIAGALLKFQRPKWIPAFRHHSFFYFTLYVIGVTFIGSFFWPIDAMVGRSIVYEKLRSTVQILNWLIAVGVAWQIAISLSIPNDFKKIRKIVIAVGIVHSLYALYQIFAFYFNLPMTGINRPYSEIGEAYGISQYGIHTFENIGIYRVNSFVGEPKHFGTISLIWIGLLLSLYLEGAKERGLFLKTLLFFIVLLLTQSTVAFIGCLIALILATVGSFYYRKTNLHIFIIALLIIGCGTILLDKMNIFSIGKGNIIEIISERSTQRLSDIVLNGPNDLPEIEAIEVLKQKPYLGLLGTGLGGISFYIAKNLYGSDIILTPNNGFLSFICSIGIIGVFFMIICFKRGIYLALSSAHHVKKEIKSLAFVGLILILQSFVFNSNILTFAFGFLLAAEFMNRKNESLNEQEDRAQ